MSLQYILNVVTPLQSRFRRAALKPHAASFHLRSHVPRTPGSKGRLSSLMWNPFLLTYTLLLFFAPVMFALSSNQPQMLLLLRTLL